MRQTLALQHLTISGAIVSTTPEHPFMVQGRGWQPAGNLRPGDVLITPEGTTLLEAVEIEERDLHDIVEVYNFHVENNLNYYVHAGDTPVLVHNAHNPKPPDLVTARSGEVIDRARISTRISTQKQARHVDGPNYRHGGYFAAENAGDAQKVLNEFHDGTATVIGLKGTGDDAFIAVESPNITAFNHNPRAGFPNQPTNTFFIKGSASPSVVPTTPGWTP
ncbi:Hint domain-containing protein [Promicromonospora soli]